MTVPACIFGGKLDGVRSPLLTLSFRWKRQEEKRTKDKQEKKKTLPNQDDDRWELWVSVAPAADGRLPAALLRPEDPARHHPQSRQAWPGACTQHQQMGGMDGRVGWAAQAGHLSPDPCCQPPAPASGGTSGHPHRQCLPKTGGWRWTDRTVGGRGSWETPSPAGPAGDRHAIQVLWDPREGPASSLHLGPLAPLSLRTSFGRTHLSMQFVPTPPWHERPRSSRPSGLLSHMESISTLRNRGGGTGGPPR